MTKIILTTTILLLPPVLPAELIEDPFEENLNQPLPTEFEITLEAFKFSKSQAAELFHQNPSHSNLYEKALSQATLTNFQTLTTKSGTPASLESIIEYIYPTDYEPPQTIPDPKNLNQYLHAIAPCSPTAFETKNIGKTLEIQITPAHPGFAKIEFEPTDIGHSKNLTWSSPPSTQKMPQFNVTRSRAHLTVPLNKPTLSHSSTNLDQPNQIELSFLTIRTSQKIKTQRPRQYLTAKYEAFSLPTSIAAQLVRQSTSNHQLYKTLTNRKKSPQAQLKSFMIQHLGQSTPITIEHLQEYISPTEYAPPGPNFYNHFGENEKSTFKPPNNRKSYPTAYTAFETKNIGNALELTVDWNQDTNEIHSLISTPIMSNF